MADPIKEVAGLDKEGWERVISALVQTKQQVAKAITETNSTADIQSLAAQKKEIEDGEVEVQAIIESLS